MKKLIFAIFVIATLNVFGQQPDKPDNSGYIAVDNRLGGWLLWRTKGLYLKCQILGMDSSYTDPEDQTHYKLPSREFFPYQGKRIRLRLILPPEESDEAVFSFEATMVDYAQQGPFPMEKLMLVMQYQGKDTTTWVKNWYVLEGGGADDSTITSNEHIPNNLKDLRDKLFWACGSLEERVGIEEWRRR